MQSDLAGMTQPATAPVFVSAVRPRTPRAAL